MYAIQNFEAFIIAGIILNLTPGADTMYILGRSISQGKKAGLLSALGISSGGLIHCIFAALGLSIILAQSALLFNIIKYLGAAYLVYLGIKTLLAKNNTNFNLSENDQKNNLNYTKIYISGILTNVLNPKVALFFLAFLPQFIAPQHVENPIPFIILGATFLTTGTIWCILLALFSSILSKKISKNYHIKKWMDKITGGIFILLGIKLALSKQ